jgi:hypothetical protein
MSSKVRTKHALALIAIMEPPTISVYFEACPLGIKEVSESTRKKIIHSYVVWRGPWYGSESQHCGASGTANGHTQED